MGSERGASSTEYGVLITLIATAVILVIAVFGGLVGGMFTDSCQGMLDDGVSVALPGADCEDR